MKISLLLLGLLLALQSTAQNGNLDIGKSYIFNASVKVVEYDLLNDKQDLNNKRIAKRNHIFTLEKVIERSDSVAIYIIKFWAFKKTKQERNIKSNIKKAKQALEGAQKALSAIKETNREEDIKKAEAEVIDKANEYNKITSLGSSELTVIKNKNDNIFIDSTSNNKFYAISASDFATTCIEYKKRNGVSFGALLLPIKLRFWEKDRTRFDFSKDVTLGTSIGYKWGFNKKKSHYFNLLLGVGITSVSVDSLSSGGFVNKSTELGAFSVSVGCLFEFEKIQAGLFWGVDLMGREAGDKWVYQSMPWLSIGIGYQILSDNLKKEPKAIN